MSGSRMFVAVQIPLPVRRVLSEVGAAIRDHDPAWLDEKWVVSENLHVTVKFLGEVDEPTIHAIDKTLASIAARHGGLDLALLGITAVPDLRRCRMIWAAFEDSDGSFSRLASDVDTSLTRYGFETESRDFKAHATLCRARKPKALSPSAMQSASVLSEGRRHSMSVASLTLLSSRLTRQGPIYSAAGEYALGSQVNRRFGVAER